MTIELTPRQHGKTIKIINDGFTEQELYELEFKAHDTTQRVIDTIRRTSDLFVDYIAILTGELKIK